MANFDVVVFGATSFVGQILTRYLFERHGVAGEIRWAIAGRSAAKLAELTDRQSRSSSEAERQAASLAAEVERLSDRKSVV